ncbi:MAG: methylated-DNA--[protein]-cysteine S-methyltransferase [Alphaproteobacteria bacterium]
MPQLSLQSPVGELTLSEEDGALVSLDWGRVPEQSESTLLGEARRQLERYFDGDPAPFELPLAPPGSDFQRRVWARMQAIPAGRTLSYGALARELGSAARAVGAACGANPIPIIVPCHRVIAADGGLGGYSGQGGVETKQALLRLEGGLPF